MTKEEIAIKEVRKESLKIEKVRELFITEIKIMEQLKGKNQNII